MRVTNAPASRKRRKRMLTLAKGYRLKRSKLYRYASDAVDHGLQYAYRDRKTKKRTYRYLWQIRINAAQRFANAAERGVGISDDFEVGQGGQVAGKQVDGGK